MSQAERERGGWRYVIAEDVVDGVVARVDGIVYVQIHHCDDVGRLACDRPPRVGDVLTGMTVTSVAGSVVRLRLPDQVPPPAAPGPSVPATPAAAAAPAATTLDPASQLGAANNELMTPKVRAEDEIAGAGKRMVEKG